jgi:hypothetical protein
MGVGFGWVDFVEDYGLNDFGRGNWMKRVLGYSKKKVAFSEATQNSLPLMFGSNLIGREVIRGLD